MADSDLEYEVILIERRKPEGHAGASTYNTPTDRDDESRGKAVNHTSPLPHGQDPKLLHHLDGHLIIRQSHTPFASGGFCDIFIGHHTTYGKVAMRRPRMTEKGYELKEMTDFLAESEIWKKLNHPNILQFLGLIQSDGYIWAVSRFAENGSLSVYLKRHPETDRRVFVFQLADAVAYLHREGVVHGDIKGSNILISAAATVLLCDFGLSKLSDSTTRSSLSGAASIRWCAPEVLIEEAPKTFASDVYSFGMTVSEILTGNVPFYTIPNEGLVIGAIYKGLRPPRGPNLPESGDTDTLWDVASKSWDGSPSNRPTMEVVCKRFGLRVTSRLGTVKEDTSSIVDKVAANAIGGEQMRCGIGNSDERTTDTPQVVQESGPQSTDIIDDEIIQRIPRAKAQYNSSLRRGARRCLQDTRVGLLEMLHGWIDGTGPHNEPIFWLSGEAGTGKSTIAHTIAEDRNATHQLGASFFFSRNEEARRDASLCISTIAYQLSVFDKSFKAHLAASLRNDPTLSDRTIKEQLKEMVMEPLKKTTTLAAGPIVIVVDALDECSPDAGAEEILEAWADLIRGFPLRFRLLITSRPSWHIKAKIESAKHLSTVFRLRDIGEIVVKSDIEHYLRESLADVLDGGWRPATWQCYPNREPRRQLQALLYRRVTLGLSPVQELDTLYLDIVKGVPQGSNKQAEISAFKEVVGAMIVAGIPMTPIQLSDFLQTLDQGDVLYILRRLSSVIYLSDSNSPASFFHQSFSEFLTDQQRCTNRLYAIDKSQAHLRMALKCLDTFDKHLQGYSEMAALHQDQELSAPGQTNILDAGPEIPAQDSEIPEAVSLSTSQAYPNSLCYACVYFSYHLQGMAQSGDGDDLACLERFEAFYMQKRTQWLDVITSLHDIPGLNGLSARLHSGYIKYYQKQRAPLRYVLNQMFSFQRKLQPLPLSPERPSTARRLTPSSIPFFRRSSSQAPADPLA